MPGETRLELSYVLPLRWSRDEGIADLAAYLRDVAEWAEVLVIDGSPADRFALHAAAWPATVAHRPPDPDLGFAYGKVNGVTTGLRAARHERVVIADDDVRYGHAELERISALLEEWDLVRPQNYFTSLPWHAAWDTGRTLLNRALGHDYPGTLGVRRSAFLAGGGYDGDVLFENLELIRTVEAAGGRVASPPDLFVARTPPSFAHFRSQRVRQAYDSFAQPPRLAGELMLAPLVVAGLRGARGALAAGAVLSAGVAEAGRRRGGGSRVFPAVASALAPLWLLERAVCSWLALGARLRGGVRYAGTRLATASHSPGELRRRRGAWGHPGPLDPEILAGGRRPG